MSLVQTPAVSRKVQPLSALPQTLPLVYLEIPLAFIATDRQSLARLIGNMFRELRMRRGYSQLALASNIGSHRTHVSRIEHGLVTPRLALLIRAATCLGVEKILIRTRN